MEKNGLFSQRIRLRHLHTFVAVAQQGTLGRAAETLIAELDTHAAVPLDSLAYRFDLVLRGHRATLFENRTQGAAR